MDTVEIKLLDHHGKRLGIYFALSHPINRIIRTISGAKWTNTHRCWHLEDTPTNRSKLRELLNANGWLDDNTLMNLTPEIKNSSPALVRTHTSAPVRVRPA